MTFSMVRRGPLGLSTHKWGTARRCSERISCRAERIIRDRSGFLIKMLFQLRREHHFCLRSMIGGIECLEDTLLGDDLVTSCRWSDGCRRDRLLGSRLLRVRTSIAGRTVRVERERRESHGGGGGAEGEDGECRRHVVVARCDTCLRHPSNVLCDQSRGPN